MPPLIALHAMLATAALLLGAAVLLRPKGTPSHKLLGRIWVVSLTAAAGFIRRGNVRAHKGFMVGTFLGLAGAAAGALAPGRAISRLFF